MESVLGYKDVAKMLNVCERTVWKLVHNGSIRASKMGRLVRIEPEAVQEYLKSTEIKSE